MKKYTMGLIFNSDMSEVLLIMKNRPIDQKGKLNGLGGKVEDGESSIDCLIREVSEESGLNISPFPERHFARLTRDDDFSVEVYSIVIPDNRYYAFCSIESEIVKSYNLKDDWEFIKRNSMENIPSLIMAAMYSGRTDLFIEYKYRKEKNNV